MQIQPHSAIILFAKHSILNIWHCSEYVYALIAARNSVYLGIFRYIHVYSSLLKAHSQVWESLWKLKAFKIDEKCFLFHLKSSLRSQDTICFDFLVMYKNVMIRKIKVIQNLWRHSLVNKQTIAIYIA